MSEKVKAAMEKAKGKKAKVKSLDDAVSGTKALKLPKDVKEAFADAFPRSEECRERVCLNV